MTLSLEELKDNPSLSKLTVVCAEHDCEPFKYFDQDCQRLICRDCFALQHRGHKCVSMNEAAADIKRDMGAVIDKASMLAKNVESAKIKAQNEIEHQQSEILYERHQLSEAFEKLRLAVSERESTLMSKLNRVCSDKTTSLSDYIQRLSVFLETLRSGIDTAKSILEFPKEEAALFIKGDIEIMLDTLIRKAPELKPPATSNWAFKIDTHELIKNIESVGSIRNDSAVGNYVTVSGEGACTAHIGCTPSFLLSCFDRKGRSVQDDVKNFEVTMKKLSAEDDTVSEDEIEVQIMNHKNGLIEGRYNISKVNHVGTWELFIRNKNGYCVRGSPFKVNVYPKFRFQKGNEEDEKMIQIDCSKEPSLIEPLLSDGTHTIDLCIEEIDIAFFFEIGIVYQGERCGFKWMKGEWNLTPLCSSKSKQPLHVENPTTGTLIHMHLDLEKKLLFLSVNGRSRTFRNFDFPEAQFYVTFQGSIKLLS